MRRVQLQWRRSTAALSLPLSARLYLCVVGVICPRAVAKEFHSNRDIGDLIASSLLANQVVGARATLDCVATGARLGRDRATPISVRTRTQTQTWMRIRTRLRPWPTMAMSGSINVVGQWCGGPVVFAIIHFIIVGAADDDGGMRPCTRARPVAS